MRNKMVGMLTLVVVLFAGSVSADPLTMNCPSGLQDMSANAGMTFGGSGIPKDAVCVGAFGGITLALTAHQRYVNPPVGNDGVDTFFTTSGDDTANGKPAYAMWNWGWYAQNNSTGTTYNLDVIFDADKGLSTDESQMGFIRMQLAPGATLQNSWNLGMGFVDTGVIAPGLYSPTAGFFNQYVPGEYNFALRATPNFNPSTSFSAFSAVQPTEIAMRVNVPEPQALALFGFGLVAVASRLRRRV